MYELRLNAGISLYKAFGLVSSGGFVIMEETHFNKKKTLMKLDF